MNERKMMTFGVGQERFPELTEALSVQNRHRDGGTLNGSDGRKEETRDRMIQ